MKNKMNFIWLIVGLLFLGALFWFGLGGGFGFAEEETEKDYTVWDYDQGFDPSDRNPYGTFVLKELMDTGIAQVKLKLVESHLDLDQLMNKEDAIYMFLGHRNFMNDANVDKLLEFVSKGNAAFLAYHEIPIYLEHALFEEYIYTNGFESESKPAFIKVEGFEAHQIPFIHENDTSDFYWNHFEQGDFFETFDKLGTIEGKVDFIKIKYGEGQFFLHLNPYIFTNVNILEEEGLKLVEEVFSKLPEGNVYWDMYSSQYHYRNYYEKHSVLEFILNNQSLRWAFLTLLIGVLIFGIFASKRYFNAIPIKKPNENTSLEFVETISRLYRSQGKNSDLIKIKKQNFLNFVSHHYYIHSKELNPEYIFKLSQKSNVEEEEIERLIKKLNFGAENHEVSNDYLIETHKMLESFYSKCKGVSRKHEKIINTKDLDLKLMRKSKVPLAIIGIGGLVLFFGVILLTLGAGLGTLLILLGLFTAIFGYILFSSPLVVIKGGELAYQKWMDRHELNLFQLETSAYDKENQIFELNSRNEKLRIDLNDLSTKDQNKLISTIRNIKLK